MVLRVRAPQNDAVASQALARLCEEYWYPLYAYVRRRGFSVEDAQDLTQSFFSYVLTRNLFSEAQQDLGKLRTFLLKAFERHIADIQEKGQRQKRGGGVEFIPLETGEGRYSVEPADAQTPDVLFERAWAHAVLDGALRQLAKEESKAGRAEAYEVLRQFLTLDLAGESDYQAAAVRLSTTVDSLRHMVRRLRNRFRHVLRQQIADTLIDPSAADIDTELASLRKALSS